MSLDDDIVVDLDDEEPIPPKKKKKKITTTMRRCQYMRMLSRRWEHWRVDVALFVLALVIFSASLIVVTKRETICAAGAADCLTGITIFGILGLSWSPLGYLAYLTIRYWC